MTDLVTEPSADPQRGTGPRTYLVVAILGTMALITATIAMAAVAGRTRPATENQQPAYIEFGDVVANLNSPRFSRYLRVRLVLVVDKSDQPRVQDAVESKRALLRSWIIGRLADLQLSDVRGSAGQAQLKREITRQFNRVLFEDQSAGIRTVLFEHFNVQ